MENIKFVFQAMANAKAHEKNIGSFDCPKCGSVLNFSRASTNKHTRGKCTK